MGIPIGEIMERWQALNANMEAVATDILSTHAGAMEDLVRGQLNDGKGNDGNFFTALYSQDPYFKKPGSAKAYADYKQAYYPSSVRPYDVPNYIINGRFHFSIKISVRNGVIRTQSDDPNATPIVAASPTALGLDPESKGMVAKYMYKPDLLQYIHEVTGAIIE